MHCFAYGMNLDPSYMPSWLMHERGKGVLSDWKLVFRGLADIEPAPGERVEGALWEIDKEGLAYLDRREGHVPGDPENLYDRMTVLVDNGDEKVEAVVYVMSRDTREHTEVWPPEEGYLSILLRGYHHFHLNEAALWKAVWQSCTGAAQFRVIYNNAMKEATANA